MEVVRESSTDDRYQSFVGKEYESFEIEVGRERVQAFARAIGANDAVYHDPEAAQRAGYSDVIAPPTFPFSVALDAEQIFNAVRDMGFRQGQALHGNQWFDFGRPVIAGDKISGRQKITKVATKKGGALIFVDMEIPLTNQKDEPVCTLGLTVIIKNG